MRMSVCSRTFVRLQASPPLSWIFWAGLPAGVEYQKELGRAYPRAVAGELLGFSFDAASALLTMQFVPDCAAAFPTEVRPPARTHARTHVRTPAARIHVVRTLRGYMSFARCADTCRSHASA
jgi:hypothetical protein